MLFNFVSPPCLHCLAPSICILFVLRHSSAQLFEALRLSPALKNISSLADVVKKCLRIALPAHIASPFIATLESDVAASTTLPSASLIRLHELTLDLSMIMVEREWSKSTVGSSGPQPLRCVRFAWSDSSPMCGFDWLWCAGTL